MLDAWLRFEREEGRWVGWGWVAAARGLRLVLTSSPHLRCWCCLVLTRCMPTSCTRAPNLFRPPTTPAAPTTTWPPA